MNEMCTDKYRYTPRLEPQFHGHNSRWQCPVQYIQNGPGRPDFYAVLPLVRKPPRSRATVGDDGATSLDGSAAHR